MSEYARKVRAGVAFYSAAEWGRLRELAADPEALEDSYEEWRKVYEDSVRGLAASGVVTEPVEVSVEELHAWCLARKRPLDAEARVEFASEFLTRRSERNPPLPHLPRFWRG
jgi:hypothetical protein